MVDPYIADIRLFAGTYAPRNWAFCKGQLLQVSEYEALFSIIGNKYGGDGRSNFALPNLSGRVPVGMGQSPGTSNWQLAAVGGSDTITLTTANLPIHTHQASVVFDQPSVSVSGGSVSLPISTDDSSVVNEVNNGYLAQGGNVPDLYTQVMTQPTTLAQVAIDGISEAQPVSGASVSVVTAGLGESFHAYQASMGLNYIICLQGLYPTQN